MLRRILVLLIPLVLLGCPDDTTSDGDAGQLDDAGADSGVSETAGAMLARLVCEREQACCPGNTTNCRILATVLDGWFEGDGVMINPSAVDACVTLITTMDCSTAAEYAGRPPVGRVCSGLTTGTKTNGETCGGLFDDEQCASNRCDEGTCAALANVGETCGGPGHCVVGAKCRSGECVTPTAAGAVCENLSVCEDGYDCFRMMGETEARCHAEVTVQPGEACGDGKVCSLGPEECWVPIGSSGSVCGNASRCRP